MRLELSGDGQHQAAFTFDVFDRNLVPDDFLDDKYGSRYQFKIKDPELCKRVFDRMKEELVLAAIPNLSNQYIDKEVGTASLEITGPIDKDMATLRLCRELGLPFEQTGIGVAGDSLNDGKNYELSARFPNLKATHVVHYENVKTPEQLALLDQVQFAVIGEGLMGAYLDFVLGAKACNAGARLVGRF